MNGGAAEEAGPPAGGRALVAVDLGAESCRVSLLRWREGKPVVELVRRFANAPGFRNGGLHWPIEAIVAGVDDGLRQCAERAPEGIAAIAVDGWAVDYVRLDGDGLAEGEPFCYRDERTVAAERSLHRRIAPERMRALTGVQLLRINTLYQLYADAEAGRTQRAWLNLPEYLLHRWGAERVSELTNASHTQMLALGASEWCAEIMQAAGLDSALAPRLVPPGTIVGRLTGSLAELKAFADTALIAPATHDTASAIAGIPAVAGDWAYLSAGTWSLVGTLLDAPCQGAGAAAENFTNFAAVGGGICFHKNVNGMWMIKQCMESWRETANDRSVRWPIGELVDAAAALPTPSVLIDVDSPEMLLVGAMPQKINAQLVARGGEALPAGSAPAFAAVIFHSLAARYAEVLRRVEEHTGRPLRRLYVVGGASRNGFLNRLTAEATGLEVVCGSAESSTLGNFAVQLAALQGAGDERIGVHAERVAEWAARLAGRPPEA